MRITAVNNYVQQSKTSVSEKLKYRHSLKNNSEQTTDTIQLNQPSFQGKKGALIGGLLGATAGIGFVIITGGAAIMGAAITALTVGAPTAFGALAGDQAEEDLKL